MDDFVPDHCIKCGHPSNFVNPITMLCDGCEAKLDWEDNHACRRCYTNERDPRSQQQLCLVCEPRSYR